MRHAKGTHCQLKTPSNWPSSDHELLIKAYQEGEALVYVGPRRKELGKRIRSLRELLRKLPDYPGHPTTQILFGGQEKLFRAYTEQTGLQEWRAVIRAKSIAKNWLDNWFFNK